MGHRRLAGALAFVISALSACTGPNITTSPSPSVEETAAPTAVASPLASPAASPTFPLPSGVAWLDDEVLDPGTYWFNGFEPWLEVTVGEGWEVGHFHPEFFDLFLESDLAIGFGRFPLVKHRDGTTFPTTSAKAVVEAMRANVELEITDVGAASIARLSGETVDVRAKSQQTPLFETPGGDFNMDPEFIPRLHVLDVPSGTLVVLILARPGVLDEAIAATQPTLDSLRLVGP